MLEENLIQQFRELVGRLLLRGLCREGNGVLSNVPLLQAVRLITRDGVLNCDTQTSLDHPRTSNLDNNGRLSAEDVGREIVDIDFLLLGIDRIDSVSICEWRLLSEQVAMLSIYAEEPGQNLFKNQRKYGRFLFDRLSRFALYVTSWDG
jgi:hypothetical protein